METTFPRPRYLAPNRQQVRLLPTDLDATLPRTHPARAVWAFVERCDLTPLYAKILAVEGHAGRPAIDPAILVGLWLLATLDGVGSARALDRLTGAHDAYRWMCGGVGVNHHALSDFRVEHEAFLDSLLAHSVAALVSAGLASLEEIAIDGRRTRAAASAPSFRSRGALERMRAEAKARVEFLKNEVLEEADASERRVQAARRRAAEDLEKRISEALDHMPEAEAAKARNRKKRRLTKNGAQPKDETPPGDTSPAAPSGQTSPHSPPPGPEGSVPPEASPEDEEAEGQPEDQATAGSTTRTTDGFGDAPADLARVSMTDPEARVMKMADGGYRPAYNVQLATTTSGGAIVGVLVSNVGSDGGLLIPAIEEVERLHGVHVQRALADGGYVNLKAIETLTTREHSVDVFAPPPTPRTPATDRRRRRAGDSPAVGAWRERMGSEEGQTTYRRRSGAAEWANAGLSNRGLQRFNVRGRRRARSVVLWHAIAHNLTRWMAGKME